MVKIERKIIVYFEVDGENLNGNIEGMMAQKIN